MATTIPALAHLKDGKEVERSALPGLLAQAFADKLVSPQVVMDLVQQVPAPFARLLALFWMREADGLIPGLHEALMQSLWRPTLPHYQGTSAENTLIDERISTANHPRHERALIGRGSCFTLQLDRWCQIPADTPLLQTPVLILGAGPSGLLTARTLFDLGFRRISVLDEQGRYGGIWNSPQVQLTRSNPFTLRYRGPFCSALLPPAPGSGKALHAFLRQLVEGRGRDDLLPGVVQAQVRGIMAGDLTHAVLLRDSSGGERIIQAPLLINALGVGAPRPLSDPDFMQTDAEQEVEHRWQEPLRDEELARWQGQRLVFVGLSSSTITMVQQVQYAIDQGMDLSYTVLTHHESASLSAPVSSGLARDWRRGKLDGLALDLPDVMRAFRRLYESQNQREQVLTQVAHWSIRQEGDGSRSLVASGKQGQVLVLPTLARIYGLVGYEHTIHTLNGWGIGVMEGRALLDVDGEVQQATTERRIHRGYFALGPVAVGQPNASSLPGILYRLGELLPTLVARAAEYAALARP